MANLLGVHLGGTNLVYYLATDDGDILLQRTYPSPFRKTSRKLPGGEPEVLLDVVYLDIPLSERAAYYLLQTEADFMKESKKQAAECRYKQKGYSLGGKTWIQDGRIVMMGGNTPARFSADLGKGKIGIVVADDKEHIEAANDGQAAATAQGIYYKVKEGIEPSRTGYFILGTGFGFGVPGYSAPMEIGHIPVGFMPALLWQSCGCNTDHKTACMENYISGRGIQKTTETLLALKENADLKRISECLLIDEAKEDLSKMAAASKLRGKKRIDAKLVMDLAKQQTDALAVFVANLAATITAQAAVTAAHLFGLQKIGIGESVARFNPWHIEKITAKTEEYLKGNYIMKPPVIVEMTPVKEASAYGALALVAPEKKYNIWAEKMKAA